MLLVQRGILLTFLLLTLAAKLDAQERVVSLDGDDWLIAADPNNVGQKEGWPKAPRPEAKRATVPKISQFALPGYHGVMWYWRDVSFPARPESRSRYFLRFWAVFYKADVYVNGHWVGEHEGGENPFTIDVTDAARPGQRNLIAVRVLDPTNKAIDGIVLDHVPHRTFGGKYIPTPGGIIDSVELLVRPAVYVADLWVRPDWKTGRVEIDAEVVNTLDRPVRAELEVDIAWDGKSARLDKTTTTCELAQGRSPVRATLTVPDRQLWAPEHPTLYRVTSRLACQAGGEPDVTSVRCGFRDFRFENGYFRLNGKRIYVRSTLTANHAPVGIYTPYDHGTKPDLIQRGMLQAKRLGFNMVRFIGATPRKSVVDYCDEIGLMLHVENMATFGKFTVAPKTVETKARFERSTRKMILRDRNHPSVVIWGLLNETHRDKSGFDYARNSLPLVRQCDPTRFVLLSSGRWDNHLGVASGSNPGSDQWDVYLGDEHPGGSVRHGGVGDVHFYARVPHSPQSIRTLRELGKGKRQKTFLSEYGVGSGQHLPNILALHQQHGSGQTELYRWFVDMNDRFMADWRAWRLDEMYATPSEYFDASLAAMASKRQVGITAVRSNPNLAGHAVTSLCDIPSAGEGLLDSQRRPKPGIVDVMSRVWAPLYLCPLVEPYSLYRGGEIQLEAVLANEDVLPPGAHQAQLSVVDDKGRAVWNETATVTVPEGEPPFAIPFFSRKVAADWPAGRYRFVTQFADRPDRKGGEATFYVDEKSRMPAVRAQVTLWGRDDRLHAWLKDAGIQTTPYSPDAPNRRELILVGRDRPADCTPETFRELARRVARGSALVFASYSAWTVDKDKNDRTDGWHSADEQSILWPPLQENPKACVRKMPVWLYLTDYWAKNHSVLADMPAGGILDHVYYRELIDGENARCLAGAQPPAEAIAGGIDTSAIFAGYHSGLALAAYDFGAGQFFVTTFHICENLGKTPSAERLLRNLLNDAARDLDKPLRELPKDIDQMLNDHTATTR